VPLFYYCSSPGPEGVIAASSYLLIGDYDHLLLSSAALLPVFSLILLNPKMLVVVVI